jgi:hexosaminidase
MHMLHRMAGTEDISALRVLADVVEPVKDYNRWDDSKGPIDFHAPLTRMIDTVYPESDVARRFGNLVQAYIQSGFKDQAAEAQIRTYLTTWRDNDAKLHPLMELSFLLHEATPLSENLAALGAAGLQSLDYLAKSQPSPESWRTQQLALVDRAKARNADVLLVVAPPVQQLIEASANPARPN